MHSNLALPLHRDELHVDRRHRAEVLVVGAPGDERDIDERALQAEGFDVQVADSDASALAFSALRAFDAVVIDIRLPDTDAFALCRRLKSEVPGLLPVLHLSTGIAAGEMRARGSEAGADGFLVRPYDATTLRAVVSTLVRIKREDEERQSNAAATSLLQQTLDSLPNHLAMLSATGEIVAVNRAWEAFGFSNAYSDRSAGFGANYLEVCDRAIGEGSEDARATADGIRAVIAGETDAFRLDYACHSPTEQRWFTVSAQRAARAGSVAAIVTHTNSTAEHERVASDARFRQFVETTSEGVIAMDNTGAITYANPPMRALLGVSSDDRPARTFFDFMHADTGAGLRARLARRSSQGSRVEMRVRKRDGELVDLLSTESAILDGTGTVVGMLAMLTDVTERTRSEGVLAESLRAADLDRRRLRTIMEAIPVGVGLADRDGRLVHLNASVDRIWGGDAPHSANVSEYGAYRGWWPDSGALLAPEDWALARTLATGERIEGEVVKIERFDGTFGHILNSAAPILAADGALAGAVFVIVDISDREATAQERAALHASLDLERARLAAVFEQAPAFLAVLRGPRHVFERTNPAYDQLIGHRDVVGMALVDAMPEIAGQGFVELLDEVRASGVPFRGAQMPIRIQRLPGSPLETRYLDFVYQPLRDASGDEAIVVHGVDVTAQVLATEELRRIEGQLRDQFDKMPVPTSLWEARGRDFALLDFNEAAARALPLFTPLIIGKLRSEIYLSGDHEVEHLRRALREDVVLQLTVERDAGPSMGRRTFDLTIGPQQPNRVLIHAVDTTARIALETQLRQAQKLDALGHLAGGIAHDFNNILGVMMGYTGFMLDDMARDDPMAADLGEVQRAIERAAALTAQLLAFGRERPLHPQLVDLRSVLTESERLLKRVLGEDIILTLDLDCPRPLLVKVDVVQLEQVVINLAVNARDAMPTGGSLFIGVEPVKVESAEAGQYRVSAGPYVRLSVRDTGTGIDAITKLRMFDPFFTTKGVGKGTGLGLATVYGIVAQSNGYITVDSAPGKGATFHILLPEAEGVPSRLTPAHGNASIIRAERVAVVLLVEDEDSLRHVTERLLRKHGYSVIAAASPDEALNLVVETGAHFDCLVSDVVMPGMSGQELATRIRGLRGPVPVLLLSGYARDTINRRGFVDADMPLLHKPVKPLDLLHAVGALLRPAFDGGRDLGSADRHGR